MNSCIVVVGVNVNHECERTENHSSPNFRPLGPVGVIVGRQGWPLSRPQLCHPLMDMYFIKNMLVCLTASCFLVFVIVQTCIWCPHPNAEAVFCPYLVTFAWVPFAICIAYSWGAIVIQHLHPSSLPLSFVLPDATWLKPCTLSVFICHFMLYGGLTLHSPKALVFYIKHMCLLAPSERGQFLPFKGFSPLVRQFPYLDELNPVGCVVCFGRSLHPLTSVLSKFSIPRR